MGNPILKLPLYGISFLLFMGLGVTTSSQDQSISSLHIGFNQAQGYKGDRIDDRRDDRRDHRSDARSDFRSDARSEYREHRGEVRRAVRRTARRINHRHQYYHALPRGCRKVFFNGLGHFYCGGIYYRPHIDNGANVYIIVNP